MVVTGFILDKQTGDPIPSATVHMQVGGTILASAVAAANGKFSVTSTGSGTQICVSSVGYASQCFPVTNSSFDGEYELERDYKQEDEVIVDSTIRKKSFAGIVIALLALLLIAGKKR